MEMEFKFTKITPDHPRKLAAGWKVIEVDDEEYKDQIVITPYTNEKAFKYHKHCDWNTHRAHGLEDKNGNIYVLFDSKERKRWFKRTITREEFDLKYFTEAL